MIKLLQRHKEAEYLPLPIQVPLSGITITRGLIGTENIQRKQPRNQEISVPLGLLTSVLICLITNKSKVLK